MVIKRRVNSLDFRFSLSEWSFPEYIYPLPSLSDPKDLQYRLIARIVFTEESGMHFKTMIRTTDDLVFKMDGMAIHTHTGIRKVSLHHGRDYDHCLNFKKNRNQRRDLSEIVGIHSRTLAVFYILDDRVNAQNNFFRYQQSILKWADEMGSIEISNHRNDVKFASLTNCINNWISVPIEEINWLTKHPKYEYQLNV